MQHATIWAEKLQAPVKKLRAPAPASASKVSSEHVIVGDFSPPSLLQERVRPEMGRARKAVMRIADAVEAAERRTIEAEEQLQTVAEFTRAQINDCRAQTTASEGALAEIKAAIEADARAASEQLRAAELRAAAAQEFLDKLERQAAAASAALAETEQLVIDAQTRVLAAETIASEAKKDIEYLEAFIREQLRPFENETVAFHRAAA